MSRNTHRTSTRATATVRSRECLMEIQMKYIKAHISRTDDTHERVHVGTVIIKQSAAVMNQGSNFLDILLEQSECIRIGHHDAGDGVIEKRLKVLDIHQAIVLRLHLNDFETADSSRSRIGSVCAVRNNDSCSLVISAGHVILTDDHQTGELTMGSGKRIQCKLRHTCNRRKCMSEVFIKTQNTLNCGCRLERMQPGESWHGCNLLVYLRIIFHCAASERIEARIHTEIHLGKIGVMTHHVKLTHLRKSWDGLALEALRKL